MQNRSGPDQALVTPVPDEFERLRTELAEAPSGYSAQLSVNVGRMGVAGRCDDCCHWSLPLNAPYRDRATVHGVGLSYAEWIVWAWHVNRHQQSGAVA